MVKAVIFGLVCAVLLLQSCTTDKYETDPCAEVSFLENIQPLVNLKCAVSGCHVQGFQPGDFTNYEVIKEKVTEGKLQRMVFELGIMPPVNKLSAEEMSLLKCWVENGAHYN